MSDRLSDIRIDKCLTCGRQNTRKVIASTYDMYLNTTVFSVMCKYCGDKCQMIDVYDYIVAYDKSVILDEIVVSCFFCGNYEIDELEEVDGHNICIDRKACVKRIK